MARPFLKWAGGKSRIARDVAEIAGEGARRYIEPFVGGGAVFFAVRERHPGLPALLADANAELIGAYTAIRDDVEGVIGGLRPMQDAYLNLPENKRADYYYERRACRPDTATERAARLIFLNKTCYNGLYRVNRRGEFNVPHGRYKRPRILDEAGLRAVAVALRNTDLCAADFEAVCDFAKADDFVYLDPPYQPMSATANFTSYTATDFGMAEQERLKAVFDALTGRGVRALLSNSDHPAIRSLYEGYAWERVPLSRAINSKADGRAAITELLIRNFG